MPATFWFTISWMLVMLRLMSAVTQDCSSAAVATWALAPLIWLTASVMPPISASTETLPSVPELPPHHWTPPPAETAVG